MQKLTVLTAAVAVGVMTFALGTANAEPWNPRADQGFPSMPAKSTATATASIKKAKAAKVERASARKAVKVTVRRKAKRTSIAIDPTTTASIAPRIAAPAAGVQYAAIVARYASSYGVPASLAHAVIKIESNYRPNMVGNAGEIGLMQIKPATARMMGYSGSVRGLYDPDTNIKYGMKYLAMARELAGGTTCGTILKYNAGHGATRMNPISAAYCSKVKVQMAALGSPA